MKKPPSIDAHNHPQFFFSVLTTGPKPAQISNIFHRNLPPHDFSIMTLAVKEGWLWIPLISWFILQLYFPAPLLRCIHYVFEKIHTSIDKKGYIHLSIWENTYIHTRVRPRFFDQVGHQTTNAPIGNKHFFIKW